MLGCNLIEEKKEKGWRGESNGKASEWRAWDWKAPMGVIFGRRKWVVNVPVGKVLFPIACLVVIILLPVILIYKLAIVLFKKKPEPLVGIDIGSSGIKLIEFGERGGKRFLKKFDFEKLEPLVVESGAIMDFERFDAALGRLVARNGLQGRRVALGISGHSVISKHITLPEMTPEELAASMRWEAEQYIPFDLNFVYVDWQRVESDNLPADCMCVLLTAAKKDVVDDYREALKRAGMRPVVVDIEGYALVNAFAAMYEAPKDKTVVLADVGAGMTNLAVLARGHYAFSRDIALGTSSFSEKGGESRLPGTQVVVREIGRSLEFCESVSSGNQIDIIYLFGGGAKEAAFVSEMKNRFTKSQILIGDSLAGLRDVDGAFGEFKVDELVPEYAVAVGLALRKG